MKKQLIYFAILSCLSFLACKNEAEPNVALSDCLRKTVNEPVFVADVKSKIYGEWQLIELIADIPNPKVPNLKVIFKDVLGNANDKQLADIYENGKLISTMAYYLKQNNSNSYHFVEIVSDSTKLQNGDYNFIKGSIRICENQMMIDNGIALDAPGYVFIKIGEAK